MPACSKKYLSRSLLAYLRGLVRLEIRDATGRRIRRFNNIIDRRRQILTKKEARRNAKRRVASPRHFDRSVT